MTMERAPVIVTRGLIREYLAGEDRIQALAGVDLTVEQGEFVAVEGPSGSGKSTLLSVLGLLEAPDGGEYRLAGTDVTRLGFNQRAAVRNRHIGFIFQAFNLIGDMSVLDNVCLPLRYQREIPKREHAERAMNLLARVGLAERAGHCPTQLSGGQQQRVAIARALVTEPALLLADEPTGNLDSRHADDIMALLGELHGEGATVFLVTHDPRYAAQARRRLWLSDGRLHEAGARETQQREAGHAAACF